MNDQVNSLLAGYMSAYDTYKAMAKDQSVMADFDKVRNELVGLAEKYGDDYAKFTEEAAKTNIFMRYSEEMQKAGKAVMAQKKASGDGLSVAELRAQFNGSLNQAKAAAHQYETVKTYEQLLAICDRHTGGDSLDVQKEAFESGLMLRTSAIGNYDTHKLMLDKCDPNDVTEMKYHLEMMAAASKVRSVDELMYLADLISFGFQGESMQENFIHTLLVRFAGELMSFEMLKQSLRLGIFERMPGYISGFIVLRQSIRMEYEALKNDFGIDWSVIAQTPRYKKYILQSTVLLPDSGRLWESSDPGNIEWMKETLFDEALSGLTVKEILLRVPARVWNPLPLDADKKGIPEKQMDTAIGRAKSFYWGAYAADTLERAKQMYLDNMRQRGG